MSGLRSKIMFVELLFTKHGIANFDLTFFLWQSVIFLAFVFKLWFGKVFHYNPDTFATSNGYRKAILNPLIIPATLYVPNFLDTLIFKHFIFHLWINAWHYTSTVINKAQKFCEFHENLKFSASRSKKKFWQNFFWTT